ncbi:MAG: LL-diaminopimelate aminotransferase [Actinomycetota bacterium]|nr:LL-diaminopimelate aminotransferase [Actinomycetota bacterium]
MRFAKRLDRVPPYLFAELERQIDSKRRQGIEVISLAIGDPDLPTPRAIVDAAAEALRDPSTHQYPTNHGTDAFREAAAAFYLERFGVKLDPGSEVVPALGGKEAVGHIAMACLDPGDVCLSPEPGYPPYTSGPAFSEAEAYYLPLTEENDFFPDLESVPDATLARANLLYLNYPNNPTGAVAPEGGFERAVALARRHDLVVVHDNAYSEICFDGYTAPSFLETPGATDVGVEIFSLSKGWNMTGWRCALVAGNADVVERFRQLKSNLDSGMFEALQRACVVALTSERGFPEEMSDLYRRRRDLVVEALEAIGITVSPPLATPYLWVRVPEGYSSAGFAALVLEEANVVVSPGPGYGESGEGFVRLSLTVSDAQLEEAVRRIESSLRASIMQA